MHERRVCAHHLNSTCTVTPTATISRACEYVCASCVPLRCAIPHSTRSDVSDARERVRCIERFVYTTRGGSPSCPIHPHPVPTHERSRTQPGTARLRTTRFAPRGHVLRVWSGLNIVARVVTSGAHAYYCISTCVCETFLLEPQSLRTMTWYNASYVHGNARRRCLTGPRRR